MRRFAGVIVWAALGLTISQSDAAAANVAVGSIPGSFSVSLSGSSSYSIPIKIAPGAAGTQPQIQLNYDSQTLGGPLGAGWSLGGLSAITRGPKDTFVDGVPDAVNLNDKDGLYLDGQRLVVVRGTSGPPSDRRTEYRKANDDFTEIIRYGEHLNNSYFRVRTKGGVTLVFGNPAIVTLSPNPSDLDATIRFQDNSVAAFAESRAIDTAGNFIEFHYQSNGVGDYNVSEIDYTGRGAIDEKAIIAKDRDPFASVTFIYETSSRPLEVYIAGQLLRKDRRLTDIYSCVSVLAAPFSCKAAISAPDGNFKQTARYNIHYTDTQTSNRFVIDTVHMFGEDDVTEIAPTRFTYSSANPGWNKATVPFPDGLVLASTEQIAKGYRFVHFAPTSVGSLDLLFAAEIGGRNVSYAFQNGGPSSWIAGGQPWSSAGTNDATTGLSGFASPVPFVSENGEDLGVILAEIDGTGRTAILQSDVRAGQPVKSAYLAGSAAYEVHPEYELPFVVSKEGKVIANYRFANWTRGAGPDLLFETDGLKGFLKNAGPGAGNGWKLDVGHAPPIPLDARAHLVDLDCSGGKPALVGVAAGDDGTPAWRVYRFGANQWEEDKDPKWKPNFPASTNPEAVREVRFDGPSSKCAGLIVATAEGVGVHMAIVPSPSGWQPVPTKNPTFDLVDAQGNASKAIVANLKGDGFDGIFANTLLPNGPPMAFAFTQDANGWNDASGHGLTSDNFVPDAPVASLDPSRQVFSVAGPIVGQGGDDIAILNDQRVTASDDAGRNRQFGKFYTNDGTHFQVQTSFAPPIPFATPDKTDSGVRFVDLHGTGLPDAIFSRLVTQGGKTYLATGAYRNTGHGWVPEPGLCTDSTEDFDTANVNPPMKSGLCPPIPFARS